MRVIKRIGIPILIVFLLASLFSCLPKQSVSFNSAHICEVSSEVKEAYNEAIASICVLDEKIIEQINVAYQRQYGMPLCLNDYAEVLGERLSGSFCYGVFDSCVVVFLPTLLQAAHSVKVANEVFSYGTSFALLGYCDGEFFPLNEAYEKGFITEDEVAIVAERHRKINYYNELNISYERATSGLYVPDETKKDDIKKAFFEKGLVVEWFDIGELGETDFAYLRSYGEYNECTIMLLTSGEVETTTNVIADVIFECPIKFTLWVYNKGVLYTIYDALDMKLVSSSDINIIYAKHRAVEWYLELCNMDNFEYYITIEEGLGYEVLK